MAELTLPQVNFSALGQLPQVYRQGVNERGVRDAFAGGIGSDPQSLSALAANVGQYNPQLGMSLAQLGISAQNRQADDAWRREEAARSQKNADRSYGLQAQTATQADPMAKAATRAKVAQQYGLTPDMPEFKAFVLNGELPAQNSTVSAQTEQRKAAAASLGMTPDNPGYQSYILTGKMPREDAQPLTATDKKAILEADEGVMTARSAIDALNKAGELSKKAFAGPAAGGRGYAASFLGETSDLGKSGIATAELNNVVTSNALSQLKAIFGGAPTEGERKILLDIQGSVNQPHEVRVKIYDRARQMAENRLKFNEQRAGELRGGQFYKPAGAKSPAAASPQGNSAGVMLQQAKDAIAQGAPRDAVLQRLQRAGVDVSGL